MRTFFILTMILSMLHAHHAASSANPNAIALLKSQINTLNKKIYELDEQFQETFAHRKFPEPPEETHAREKARSEIQPKVSNLVQQRYNLENLLSLQELQYLALQVQNELNAHQKDIFLQKIATLEQKIKVAGNNYKNKIALQIIQAQVAIAFLELQIENQAPGEQKEQLLKQKSDLEKQQEQLERSLDQYHQNLNNAIPIKPE